MIAGMVLGLALMATAPADGGGAAAGEALPPTAPSDPYELTAWCYGALGEYLTIYEQVIPDLQAIDRQFGTSVVEDRPYSADVAAAREAMGRFARAMEAAEKASARPIAERGAQSIQRGRGIWARAETQPRRQLARAWLYWGVPDACDATAQALYQRSVLAAPALAYNTQPAVAAPSAPAPAPTPQTVPGSEIRRPAAAPSVFAASVTPGMSTPLSAQIAATLPRPTAPPPAAAPPMTVVASAARPSRIVENDEGAPPPAQPTTPVSRTALPLIAPPPPAAPVRATPPVSAPSAATNAAPITTAVRPAPPSPVEAPVAAPAPAAPAAVVQAPTPLGPVSSDEPMEPLM